MSHIVYTYDDLEESLQKIKDNLDLVEEEIYYDAPTDVQYYEWDNGNYEDVGDDLYFRLFDIADTFRKVIKHWNQWLDLAKNNADSRFYQYYKEEYKIKLQGEENENNSI